MKLRTHIRHVHWTFRKGFQRPSSKVKVITRWHSLLPQRDSLPPTYGRPSGGIHFAIVASRLDLNCINQSINQSIDQVAFLWFTAPLVYFLSLLFCNIPSQLRKPPRRLQCLRGHWTNSTVLANSLFTLLAKNQLSKVDIGMAIFMPKTVNIGSLDVLQLLKNVAGTYPTFHERNMKCSIV